MKLGQGLLVIGVILTGALLFGAYSATSAPLPEGFPAPTAEGEIEIKQYPVYRAATVQVTGELASASSRGFSPLFRHISDNGISMTAPVEAQYPIATLEADVVTEGETAVSFLYRNLEIAPEAVAGEVRVEDNAPMTVVSVGVRGGYDYAIYTRGIERLNGWLAENPDYAVAGAPRRFFYDGPFIPDSLKRSDIQIPIERK